MMNKLIDASRLALDIAYSLADLPLALHSLVLRARYGSMTKANKDIEGTHTGERCFVLGGGPSLRTVDLGRLAKEDVISVNMLYRWDSFAELTPAFHCAIDPGMYIGDIGDSLLEQIRSRPETRFLLSAKAPKVFTEHRNVNVVSLGYLPSSLCRPYDISKPSAAFINVVLFAIELALYIGYSEIVLLGCDFSQFASRIDAHAYEEEDAVRQCTLFDDLQGHSIALMQHEWLRRECERKGVRVVNATEGSMLDVWPVVDLGDVF